MTAKSTERVKKAQAAREAAGGRCVRVILSPAAVRALEQLTAHGQTMTAAIDAALQRTAMELPPEPGQS